MATGCFDLVYAPAYDLERQRVDRHSHGGIFPIDSGAHAGVDCNDCHGEFGTFTEFTCISCHEHAQAVVDASHAGTPGYGYGPTTCYSCHPTGEGGMSRAAHDRFFPIVSGRHGGLPCVDCHPSTKQSFVCTDCHEHACSKMNEVHADEGGYSCDSTACLACHPRGVAGDD
jgi:hypothetical protein